MFRQSDLYYEVRHQAFQKINNDLAQELEQMKISDGKDGSTQQVVKKSVSKQQFLSYFTKKEKPENQQMEFEPTLTCKQCDKFVQSANQICQDCSGLICQRCIIQCYNCGQHCCVICSVRVYLSQGDFIVCLRCGQQS